MNNFDKDLKPHGTNLSGKVNIVKSPNFRLSSKINYIYFNRSSIQMFDLIAGDRVGFLFSDTEPLKCFIYFTQNKIGTLDIIKYQKYPHRVNSRPLVARLCEIYKVDDLAQNTSGISVYINKGISIDVMINGQVEKCYLLTVSISERNDISSFVKEYFTSSYKEIFKKLKEYNKK